MISSSWNVRERPLLEAVGVAEESGNDLDRAAKAAVPGLDKDLYAKTVAALKEAGYLRALVSRTYGGTTVMIEGLAPEGRRAVGQWPSPVDPHEAFLRAVDDLMEGAADPETKGRLQRLRSAAGDLSREVLASVLAAYMQAHAPGLGG